MALHGVLLVRCKIVQLSVTLRTFPCQQVQRKLSGACCTNVSSDGILLDRSKNRFNPSYECKRYRQQGKKILWPVNYLPFEWSYPPKKNDIDDPGDLTLDLGPVDKNQPKLGYEHCEELKTASPEVRKLFTLETATRNEIMDVKRDEMIKRVQRHPLDFDSLEVKIAKRTFAVRNRMELYKSNPSDKCNKVILLESIQKRNKYLKMLRYFDYRRFEFVCHQLQVVHRSTPMTLAPELPFTRNNELRRLTREYCEKLKQSKIDAYYEKLKAEREEFKLKKDKTLEEIKKEEEELKMTEEEKMNTDYKTIIDLKYE